MHFPDIETHIANFLIRISISGNFRKYVWGIIPGHVSVYVWTSKLNVKFRHSNFDFRKIPETCPGNNAGLVLLYC